jgi:thiamine biosynthesis lipoprotein
MRAVFPTMGTVASIDLPDHSTGHPVVQRIRDLFDDAEQRFSLYRPDSELSRVAAGEIGLPDASDELRAAYAAAMDWHLRTAGAFTPNRPDGVIDLNGVVKALSIASAGRLLQENGIENWSVNVGGDIASAGRSGTGAWTAGIIDPNDRTALLATLSLDAGRSAIATSGSAERGDHIWLLDRVTEAELIQVTVVAADILEADVLATAIIAGGRETLDFATDRWAIDVLAVTRDGALLATPGLRAPASAA